MDQPRALWIGTQTDVHARSSVERQSSRLRLQAQTERLPPIGRRCAGDLRHRRGHCRRAAPPETMVRARACEDRRGQPRDRRPGRFGDGGRPVGGRDTSSARDWLRHSVNQHRESSAASRETGADRRQHRSANPGRSESSLESGRTICRRLSPVPAPQRFGGIRLSSPIELEVFEGDTRLGSSATGIVSAPAGRRELDLVNSVLGFRLRQAVDIKAGQVVPLTVSATEWRHQHQRRALG